LARQKENHSRNRIIMRFFRNKYKTRIESRIDSLKKEIAFIESEKSKVNEVRNTKDYLHFAILRSEIQRIIDELERLLD
jgi:hypothetical protein